MATEAPRSLIPWLEESISHGLEWACLVKSLLSHEFSLEGLLEIVVVEDLFHFSICTDGNQVCQVLIVLGELPERTWSDVERQRWKPQFCEKETDFGNSLEFSKPVA